MWQILVNISLAIIFLFKSCKLCPHIIELLFLYAKIFPGMYFVFRTPCALYKGSIFSLSYQRSNLSWVEFKGVLITLFAQGQKVQDSKKYSIYTLELAMRIFIISAFALRFMHIDKRLSARNHMERPHPVFIRISTYAEKTNICGVHSLCGQVFMVNKHYLQPLPKY